MADEILLNDEVLTIEDVISFLKVSEATIYTLTRSGVIPARKVGREWRYLKSEIILWLKEESMKNEEIVKLDQWGGEYKKDGNDTRIALWLALTLEEKERLIQKAKSEDVSVSEKVESFLKSWIE